MSRSNNAILPDTSQAVAAPKECERRKIEHFKPTHKLMRTFFPRLEDMIQTFQTGYLHDESPLI